MRRPLKEVLEIYGLAPKKSLGQNFILNPEITARIASVAGDLNGVTVVEIGPGPGGLTRSILDAGAKKVFAIEMDDRCIKALNDMFEKRLEVIHQDALNVDPYSLVVKNEPISIISNLPYNIGTVLLLKWLPHISYYRSLTLMFQKEVVNRLIALPNTKDYGRLSVMTQWVANVQKAFDLSPGVFTPPPKVTSSVVHITPKKKLDNIPFSIMERIVQLAFHQRRKMLKSCLKSINGEKLCELVSIDPSRRAETLSVEEFKRIAVAFLKESDQ